LKILIDINHPGHVHFFKNFIFECQNRSHTIFVTASKKDVTHKLLAEYNIPFYSLPSYGKSIFKKAFDIFYIDYCLYRYSKIVKPDLFMGIASFRAAHVASIMQKKCFIFDDTEHSSVEIALYKPFATKIFSPSPFFKNLGKNHVKYNGSHELAYLHPMRFKPDVSVLKKLNIKEGETYFIVRFVSWGAGHDIGKKGITIEGKKELVKLLEKFGKVFITSEMPLDNWFEPYRINLIASQMHNLLYYSSLYVGEGATMASEAAILGIPSVYINPLGAGTLYEASKEYGLINIFSDKKSAIVFLTEVLPHLSEMKSKAKISKEKFISNKTDVTSYLLSLLQDVRN
jgi:uncharacterized protein